MDHNVHDDEGLWNELSHQQSREIAQHVARSGFTTHSWSIIFPVAQRVAQQIQSESARLYHTVTTAASEAWNDAQRQEQSLYQRSLIDNNEQYLQDFGIQNDEQYTPLDELRQENDFLFLPRFANRKNGWNAAANLDLYLGSLYQYYYYRGWTPIIAKGMVELITLALTLVLSVFLFAYVDWSKLATCTEEATCHAHLREYIHDRPLSQWTLWSAIVLLYCLLVVVYATFAIWSFLHTLQQARAAKYVFEDRLGIPARKLEGGAIDWDRDVIQKLVELQRSGEYRIAIHGQELDALAVAQRILRKENFLVALFNRGLVDLTLPGLSYTFFCPSLEWSLYFCVLNFMFNHRYQIRPAFYLDAPSLRRRFIVCGVAHALFMPFLLFFMTLHFGLQNVYDWKSTKKYLGPREWSLFAKWTFREFNELPHHFERRLAPSYQAADNYVKLFGQSELITALGRIFVFTGGSLGAVLFLFAAINDSILLHVRLGHFNLLYYVGIVGVLYSAGKAMLPTEASQPRHRNHFAETDAALSDIAMHTHYYMDNWKGRGSDLATYRAMASMFRYKAQLFAMEVAAVVLAPYFLCLTLARSAEAICEFIFAIRAEAAGDMCGFATFDFDKFSDEAWEGRTMGGALNPLEGTTLSESVFRFGSVEQAARHLPVPKARFGKMEKSFFSFKSNHPSWKCSASGQHLIDRVEDYKRQETAALAKEQELHIEAATRQIETLARLEKSQHFGSGVEVMDHYIPRPDQAPADAGAGIVSEYVPPADLTLVPRSPYGEESNASGLARGPSDTLVEETGLPFAASSPSLPRFSSYSAQSNRFSALHADLSSELRRILNMSTLDPDVSVSDSLLATIDSTGEDDERRAERQYMWLERYHAHLAAQRQSGQQEDPIV